ncbi:HAMP domain-containing histidine kinase [Candidatus Berkelbacteria bacterium]|nr:HAMP domain-containing histidine kinase [Candidatus Berkelbacteria bacterium]
MKNNFLTQLFDYFISPRSKSEDGKRKEYILNSLLLGTFGLSLLALAVTIFAGEFSADFSSFVYPLVFIYLFVLYLFSRGLKLYVASLGLLVFYFSSATLLSVSFGVENPYIYLIYAMVITLAGILIESRAAFFAALITEVVLVGLAHFQSMDLIRPDLSWKYTDVLVEDIFVFGGILVVIAAISWIAGRQMENSLDRARKSEKALLKERNLLDVRVKERTEELRKEQLQRVTQVEQLAEFGRVSSELIHDLANPLSVISINLEKLKKSDNSRVVTRALKGAQKMQDFIDATRKQIQQQDVAEEFELVEEISGVLRALQVRAAKYEVELKFDFKDKILLVGNPVRFYQIVTNLVSNAIDSYAEVDRKGNRLVKVSLEEKNNVVIVKVVDFGSGISKKNLGNIFDPFFTTKSRQDGTGIGLSFSRRLAEEIFGGELVVKSVKDEGSQFTITIPKK